MTAPATPSSLRREVLLALGAGALAALALPPLHLLPALAIALPLLLRLAGRAAGWRQALLLGLAFGWGHHALGLYWLTHALFTDIARWWWLVPFAAPGIALPLAVFAALPVLAAFATRPGWRRVLVFAGAWVLAEMLRGVAFTGFPWNLLGTVWAFHPLPLQPAAVVGVHGLSFLTVLVAALPHLGMRRALAGGAAMLAAWVGFGAWRLAQPAPPDQGVGLALVQANVPQDVKWQPDQRWPIFRRYLEASAEAAEAARAALPGRPVVVIWPETASPFLLAEDAEARRLAAAAFGPGAMLLAGSMRAEWRPDGRLARVFNSLVGVDAEGGVSAVYDKFHLVPFGEYMPLAGLLPIRMVVGGMDFSPGPGLVTLAPGGIPPFSPLICYEVIFTGRVSGPDRPAWLLNLTNDAWFGVSAGPYQHLAAARLRAVEEGLPMVRVAQTGISAVYDSAGREVVRLPLGARGWQVVALPGPGEATPFARFGLWLPGLLACLSLLAFRRDNLDVDHDP
ncbi:MAG: apolipoprotein N-acyltransferase [Rhodovarius sp.]|nr:apolipoprotein N-acyltransferase [Rhodovarius sp.]